MLKDVSKINPAAAEKSWSVAGSVKRLAALIYGAQVSAKPLAAANAGIRRTVRRLLNSSFYSTSDSAHAPYGYFMSRPLIGDGAAISGGIYLTPAPTEALVVDDKYGALPGIVKEFEELYLKPQNLDRVDPALLVEQVAHAVTSIFPKEDRVENFRRRMNIKADQKVALDVFIQEGAGAARHKVLTAGYLLEQLIARKAISGKVTIDTTLDTERLLFTSANDDIVLVDFETRTIERGH